MNIFNSLGSNYDLSFVFKALFAPNNNSSKKKLINFLGQKYNGKAVLLYKGREAITLALEILNLPKDSFVAINGFTCFAVYKAVDTAGYFAQILDLDKPNAQTNIHFTAETLQKTIKNNPKIKAVIVQNTLGYPCDIEKIANISKQNNIVLIEDLAHSVGTKYQNDKEAGSVGDFVCLSFSQDKVIDAVSGGALIIRNKHFQNSNLASQGETLQIKQQLIDRLYPLFTYKIRKLYPLGIGKIIHFLLKKFNLLSKPMNSKFYDKYDLPNPYCNLALYCFETLEKNLNRRKKIADMYKNTLNKSVMSDLINKNINLSSNLRYPIFVQNRKSLIRFFKKQGVYLSDIWYDDVAPKCPNAVGISKMILNLPTHRNISLKNAKILAEKINLWIKSQ